MQSSPQLTPERADVEFSPTPRGAARDCLANLYFPAYRAPLNTHDSFTCSVLIGSRTGHSSQPSEVSSALGEIYDHNVSRSPMRLTEEFDDSGEDKENLGESWKTCHRRQPSVIINSALDQSYSNILSGLGSLPSSVASSPSKAFYPVEKPRKSLYTQTRSGLPAVVSDIHQKQVSTDEISDCSSIMESAEQKTVVGLEMGPPGQTFDQMLQEEHISTIYTNLSSDSSRHMTDLFSTPAVKDHSNRNTSPFARTTNHTDSNHFEIDLFETSPEAKRQGEDDSELQIGALPARAYCPTCQAEVSTRVSFELPRLPL